MEELEFDKLVEKYDKIITKYPSDELKRMEDENNHLIDTDIKRIQEEIGNIDLRISEMEEEKNKIENEKVLALQYPDQIESMKNDKEKQINDNKEFRAQKEKKIQDLKEKKQKNAEIIEEVSSIGDKLIADYKEKIEEENIQMQEEMQEEIKELEDKKELFGLSIIDKDGNKTKQYTREEKKVIEGIDSQINEIRNKINVNNEKLKIFIDKINNKETIRSLVKEKTEEDLSWEEYEKNDGYIDNKRKLGIEVPEKKQKKEESKVILANDFKEDLLKIQQTTNAKDFDKLIDELGEKYADVSETWSKRIENALIKQKGKIDESIKNQAKQSEKPKKVTEPKETKQDDFSDILEIFNTKPETQRKGVDIDIPLEDKPKKVEATPKYKPLENADSVEEGKFAAPHKTGKKIEPQYEDIIIDEDETSHIDSKILISRIEIDEATGIIRARDEHDKIIYNKQYEYDVDLKDFILADGEKINLEDEEYQKFRDEKVNKIQDRLIKQYGKEVYDEKFKNIDGRVFDLLFDLKNEALLEDYIYSIFEKDETMPFMLNYNLKDIYNTEMSLAQIKDVQEYSKIAYKQNKEMVDIKKDNPFKRAFGRIKKGIKEVINTKLLGSGKVSDERTVDRKNVVNNESEKPKEIKKTREERDDFVYGIQHDSDGKKIDPYAMYEKLPSVDDDFIIADEDDLKLEENSEDKVDDYEDYKF